jgi:hypothetical protein
MTPTPLIISWTPDPKMDKPKEAESEVNTMLFTSSEVEMFTDVCED